MRPRDSPEGRQGGSEQQAAIQALPLRRGRADDFHSRAEPAVPPGAVDMAGIQHLDVFGVENWMLTNLDRIHFFIPGERLQVCAALEVYIRARVGSVCEGASIGTKRSAVAVPDES